MKKKHVLLEVYILLCTSWERPEHVVGERQCKSPVKEKIALPSCICVKFTSVLGLPTRTFAQGKVFEVSMGVLREVCKCIYATSKQFWFLFSGLKVQVDSPPFKMDKPWL